MQQKVVVKFEPNRVSEANICHELAEVLKKMDIPYFSEYKYKNCIFDGVVFSPIKKEVILVVEVKRNFKDNDKKIKRFVKSS